MGEANPSHPIATKLSVNIPSGSTAAQSSSTSGLRVNWEVRHLRIADLGATGMSGNTAKVATVPLFQVALWKFNPEKVLTSLFTTTAT